MEADREVAADLGRAEVDHDEAEVDLLEATVAPVVVDQFRNGAEAVQDLVQDLAPNLEVDHQHRNVVAVVLAVKLHEADLALAVEKVNQDHLHPEKRELLFLVTLKMTMVNLRLRNRAQRLQILITKVKSKNRKQKLRRNQKE